MTPENLTSAHIGETLRRAIETGWVREEDTSVIFINLGYLDARIRHLVSCFPESTLHGLAIKANPLRKIHEFTREIGPGIGAEAASAGEVQLALRSGFPAGRIIFDSPVKTPDEIHFALKTGIRLNIDNLDELDRVGAFIRSGMTPAPDTIGLRINPQVGSGTILESSVAGDYSKFGVPIRYRRPELEHAFLSNPWLSGVHLHVGSQGCAMELLTGGIGVLYDFVLEMNSKRTDAGLDPVRVFDIGGGLPISYRSSLLPPQMEEYAARIRERAPMLFNPSRFKIITEFGRWVFTNAGWTVSRVEYVKHDPAVNTAMIHTGADLFVRECLNPHDWHHEYSVFNRNCVQRTGLDDLPWNLAGPLCFSGDIIAKDQPLPVGSPGDVIVVHDTGGYTFSMWSRYNSRQMPRILGYSEQGFMILKERESTDDVCRFWE